MSFLLPSLPPSLPDMRAFPHFITPSLPPQIRTIYRVQEIPHDGPFCEMM